MVDFGGWKLPVQFDGVLAEHLHCRSAAVVFDTSHMGQFLISGREAASQLSLLCTQDAETLRVGQCRYGFLLREDAGIIDDTILMRTADDEFLLVVNAATQDRDQHWVEEHLRGNSSFVNRSALGWAKIDLQGPESFDVLRGLVDIDLRTLPYFSVAPARICEVSCVLSRTGYTGELGYEIMAEGNDLLTVFDRILEHPRVKPAGLGARDSLRLEMGYPLYGHELSEERNPVEAAMLFFLKSQKPHVGFEALNQARWNGTAQTLVAFRTDTRRRPSPSCEICSDGEVVGVVTSGAFCPSLDVSAGMGFVRSDLARQGTPLIVRTERAEIAALVQDRPLYQGGTCRRKL